MHLFALLFFTSTAAAFAGHPAIEFEPNLGQTDDRVRYIAKSREETLFFTDTQIVFSRDQAAPIYLEFAGADAQAKWSISEPTGEEVSYRVGRDPRRWAEHVKRYRRLLRRNIYPGVDAVWRGAAGNVEYDFILAPHADPSQIRIRVSGARGVRIDPNGELVIASADGEIRQHRPVIYQIAADGSHRSVRGGFRMLGRNEVGFMLDVYDRSESLIIDPVINFSTYLGGEGDDQVIYSANGIIAGNTTSIDFPDVAPGRRRGMDVFYKIGASTQVIGGSGDDRLTAVIAHVGIYDNLLLGYTNSTDLPTSVPSLQPKYAGGDADGFFIYLPPSVFLSPGPGLNSTPTISYFGTTGDDRITAAGSVVRLPAGRRAGDFQRARC
jgi:hypothetical protein